MAVLSLPCAMCTFPFAPSPLGLSLSREARQGKAHGCLTQRPPRQRSFNSLLTRYNADGSRLTALYLSGPGLPSTSPEHHE